MHLRSGGVSFGGSICDNVMCSREVLTAVGEVFMSRGTYQSNLTKKKKEEKKIVTGPTPTATAVSTQVQGSGKGTVEPVLTARNSVSPSTGPGCKLTVVKLQAPPACSYPLQLHQGHFDRREELIHSTKVSSLTFMPIARIRLPIRNLSRPMVSKVNEGPSQAAGPVTETSIRATTSAPDSTSGTADNSHRVAAQ